MKKKIKIYLDNLMNFIFTYFERIVCSFLLLIFFVIIFVGIFKINVKAPVRSDAIGYFSYLPAIFTYKDLSFNFMIKQGQLLTDGKNEFTRIFNPSEVSSMYHKMEANKYLNKYGIGTAILLIPFFLLGHLFSIIFGFEPNGWSYFYQYICFWGGLVYFSLGIVILKNILLKYYSKKIVLLTIFAITFGTNLFNYATYENLFSHVYSFFLINLLILLTLKWWNTQKIKYAILIAVNAGLIILVRQFNIIFILIPIIFDINSINSLKDRIIYLYRNLKLLIITILIFITTFLPQMIYWKYATGKLLTFSYLGEGFNLIRPQLLEILIGVKRGLFFWSPTLIFACLGLFLIKNKLKPFKFIFLLVLLIQIYLISAWSCLEMGWSYGHRTFVDSMGLFAIGLAFFYSKIKHKRSMIIVLAVTLSFTFLSTFQTIQYWYKILPAYNVTLDYYRSIFLKFDLNLVNKWR